MTNRRPFILTTNPHTAQVQFLDGETYDLLETVETLPQPHEICLSSDKSRPISPSPIGQAGMGSI